MAAELLREQGYNVLAAADGEEALRIAREYAGREIHLLLTDVVMPRMGGGELVGRLLPGRPGLRVLFMSGHAGRGIVQHGGPDGSTFFIQKPFGLEGLACKIREVLDAPGRADGGGGSSPAVEDNLCLPA
jgi:CheY-like chemotaxis protein